MIRAALAILALLGGAVASGAEVEPIVEHGVDNRIGLVILGDGYRAEEQEQMSADARRLTQSLFAASPFAEHEALFTVRLVHLVSNVSGAGYVAPLDTALRSYSGCAGNGILLCTDTGEALRVAAEAFPEFDHAIVMVNVSFRAGSGGVVAVVSTDPTAGQTLVHELGHSFGSLADEYDSPNPTYWECSPEVDCPEPNVTLRTALPDIKWRAWIPQGVPLPTPAYAGYGDVVGLFEGARYHTTGIYRPVESNCAMRSMMSVFCPVCTEALVRQMWAHARPHDAVAPDPGPLTRSACEPLTFSVRTAPIAGITVSWDADSTGGACEKPLLTFPPGALAPGQHRVAALVAVQSDLVRNNPYEQLRELLTWSPRNRPVRAAHGASFGAALHRVGGAGHRPRRPRERARALLGAPRRERQQRPRRRRVAVPLVAARRTARCALARARRLGGTVRRARGDGRRGASLRGGRVRRGALGRARHGGGARP